MLTHLFRNFRGGEAESRTTKTTKEEDTKIHKNKIFSANVDYRVVSLPKFKELPRKYVIPH